MEAKNQEFKTKEQNIQINNNNNKGEKDMTKQSELTAETRGTDNSESKKDIKEATNPSTEAVDENSVIPEKDDTPSAEVEPKSAISWDFAVTADSTTLCGISNIIVEDDGDQFGDSELMDEVDAFLAGEIKFESDKLKLRAGQELLRKFYAQYNRAWSGVKGTFAEYAVSLGIFLIALKSLMKACGEKWEPWAAINLPFMSPRTRQAFMQIGKVPGIENHLYFGKERLVFLARAVKGMDGDDPIGDFLKTYELAFNPEEEINLDAYKDAVDLALFHKRLKKAGISTKMESLKKYQADGNKVSSGLIERLKAVQAGKGDPNEYLENPLDDSDYKDREKAKSFKKVATSLVGTINWIAGHEEFIRQVDLSMIDELTTELSKLKQLVIEAEAAETKQ
jgi:hypothetical protein